jgi:hypothetical protein
MHEDNTGNVAAAKALFFKNVLLLSMVASPLIDVIAK